MKFRKINETTINCIITQDDLKEHGINLDDLFDRKKNAVEFIRGVILKAANSVNLSMKNDYTSMRISVLPDRSVKKETAGKNNAADGKKDRKGLRSNTASASGTFVFEFPSIMDMAACSHILAAEPGLRSSVYFIESTGSYYLVLEKTNGVSPDYDSRVLSVNEFGTMVNCSDKTLAFMREHSDCILYRNAVQRISELYH